MSIFFDLVDKTAKLVLPKATATLLANQDAALHKAIKANADNLAKSAHTPEDAVFLLKVNSAIAFAVPAIQNVETIASILEGLAELSTGEFHLAAAQFLLHQTEGNFAELTLEITEANTKALLKRWEELSGGPPPQAIAYRVGGRDPATVPEVNCQPIVIGG